MRSMLRVLVHRFYDELWNDRNLAVADEILVPDVTFRGSLGSVRNGRKELCDYVREVTSALANYRCRIDALVVEERSAAARMTFSGDHVGAFLGRSPTGKSVRWSGAAFFEADDIAIRDIWVLGDLVGLHGQLDGTTHCP
jgi:predicted ester cyclase